MTQEAHIIDAAVRFLRSNPELLAYARSAAPVAGVSVEALLGSAVARMRAAAPSAVHAVAQEQVVLRMSS
jgi:hypothetical protein